MADRSSSSSTMIAKVRGMRRSFLSSLQTTKTKFSKLSGAATPHRSPDDRIPDLPVVLWVTQILPLLGRFSQSALIQAHREVWLSCRNDHAHLGWPHGRIAPFSRPVKSVAFCGHQLWVAYCKSTVKRYDQLTGPQSKTSIRHARRSSVAAIQCSPVDPCTVATVGGQDGCIQLWKQTQEDGNNNWTCCRVLQVFQQPLRHLIWSPQGDKVAVWGQTGLLQVSSIDNSSMMGIYWKTRMEVDGCNQSVAFSPNGKSILFAQNNDRVHQWDFLPSAPTRRILPELEDPHGSHAGTFITSLAFSPDGKCLYVGCHVATVKVWNVVENAETGSYDFVYYRFIHMGGGWSAVSLITFAPDGRRFACTNHGSQIRIVSLELGDGITTLKGHTGRIETLAFSADGGTLASGGCDRTIRLWDVHVIAEAQERRFISDRSNIPLFVD